MDSLKTGATAEVLCVIDAFFYMVKTPTTSLQSENPPRRTRC